ncbi:MAG: pilus assembly protein [Planctomycetaceae bacterium]|nr:pilus assembly protein [Planctomycetaceae bacterium]
MRRRPSHPDRRGSRRAVAASEMAVCLPILVLLVLAMIESCTMIFVKQSLTVASYEGIRKAIEPSATTAQVEAACNAVLADRRVKGATITITPTNFQAAARGTYITVSVSAPAAKNSVIPGSFFAGRTLSGSATMMKEF